MADNYFDITWREGAYYVSIPNYKGGKVYTSEYVDRLLAALQETREDLEMYGLDDFESTTEEAIDRIDAALALPSEQ